MQYDGTDYSGFVVQPNGITIAQRLLEAIRAVTGETVKLFPAGRTDAGVHARGQVVHFKTATTIPVERLPYALNAMLPPDITVYHAEVVPDNWHARFSARAKVYSYTIDNSPHPSPLLRRTAWFVPQPLDLAAMRACAAVLQGRHDFAAFRSTGGAARTSTRHLMRLEVHELADTPALGRALRIIAEADGFLYNMVRILAGTLVAVGAGRLELDTVREALATGVREKAGRTAPPQGLCLERVVY